MIPHLTTGQNGGKITTYNLGVICKWKLVNFEIFSIQGFRFLGCDGRKFIIGLDNAII